MSLAQIHIDAMTGASPFSDQGRQANGGDGDSHTRGVGDTPAGLLVPARASGTDRAFGLGDAAHGDGLPLPAVKAKDPIGLRDSDPIFLVSHLPAALLPLADIGPIEGSGEGCELLSVSRQRKLDQRQHQK